ncbi:MAG: alcohol dehydrogenase catalytic domain-containing protein [Theionarchaea archaeon]|nr:alcohol dehydrogenase catalytic domain-containing protein [Theionarchaea archaeon]
MSDLIEFVLGMPEMRAAVLVEFGKIELREAPDPEPSGSEASVEVKACGLCQTDNIGYLGARPDLKLPTILGHEIAGVVEETGDDVVSFSPGDEVVVSPVVPCGRCRFCRLGLLNHCKNGIAIGGEGQPQIVDGGFADYVLVPDGVLYPKPASVSFESAALTEPLGCAYKGLIEFSQLRLGEDVVIIGSGTTGLMLSMVGMAAGAGKLAVIDLVKERLEVARGVGVEHVINSSEVDPYEAVYDLMPDGPDVVVESAGSLDAARLAMKLARRTTRINMFGVIVPGEIGISPKEVHFTEIQIDASFSITPRAMMKSIKLMEDGLIDPGRTITHTFSLEEIDSAFEAMNLPNRVTVMVRP